MRKIHKIQLDSRTIFASWSVVVAKQSDILKKHNFRLVESMTMGVDIVAPLHIKVALTSVEKV